MLRAVAIFTSAFAVLSPAVFADDCRAPTSPDMSTPGASLSVEAFSEITTGLSRFDSALKSYRSCLDSIINAPQDHSRDEWDSALSAYNSLSSEQAALYERYDVVAKDFQIAQANRATNAANEAKANSANELQTKLASELAEMNQE